MLQRIASTSASVYGWFTSGMMKGGSRGYFGVRGFPASFLGRCAARRVDFSPSCSALRRTKSSPSWGRSRATQRRIASSSASVSGSLTSLRQPLGSATNQSRSSCFERRKKEVRSAAPLGTFPGRRSPRTAALRHAHAAPGTAGDETSAFRPTRDRRRRLSRATPVPTRTARQSSSPPR
jgi:hypothetical protein